MEPCAPAPLVQMKDTQALLAAEKHLFEYAPAGKAAVRVGVGFPNTYTVGMASLGYQLVWHFFSCCPGLAVYRFFLPEKGGAPVTLEEGLSLASMDALAFSVAFEMDYVNLLGMLQSSDIPLLSRERREEDPLVIIGGSVTLINPEPLYSFADLVYTGDLEPRYEEICAILAQKRDLGRQGTLERLSGVPGMTAPLLGVRGERQVEHELDRYCPHSVICTPYARFGDTLLFETARGCARRCRFCAAGNTTGPMRIRRPELPEYHCYGMVGAAVFDSPYSVELCRRFVSRKASFSLSSLRLETLDAEKLSLMKQGGVETVTIAPEAGTERLRDILGKSCPDERIFHAAELVEQAGFRRLKMYFMTGLPGETDEDIEGIQTLVSRLHEEHPSLSLSASAGIFVPKPRTPFADETQPPLKELTRRLDILKKRYLRGCDVTCESPRLARIQWLLAQADEELGRELLLRCLEGGYRAGLRYAGSLDK